MNIFLGSGTGCSVPTLKDNLLTKWKKKIITWNLTTLVFVLKQFEFQKCRSGQRRGIRMQQTGKAMLHPSIPHRNK